MGGYRRLYVGVWLLVIGRISGQSIDDPPDNTAGVIEDSARFNCTATLGTDVIEWRHYLSESDQGGDRIYSSNEGVLDDRFDVDELQGNNRYDLIVKDVRQSLAGTYGCNLVFSSVSTTAELVALRDLTCLPPPGFQELEQGQLSGLTCETEFYGYKQPKMEWFGPYGRVENQYTETGKTDEESEEPDNIVRQIANFSATPEHNEMNFECRLTFEKEIDTESEPPTYTDDCSTYFYVLHSPQDIELYPDPDTYPDGVISVLIGDWINCSASARPDPRYEWKDIDDTDYHLGPILEISEDMYPEEGMPEERTYRCVVTNEINGQPQVAERVFMFRIDGTAEEAESASGTEAWVIAVAVLVPLLIIGIVVALIFLYLYYKNKKNPSAGKYNASTAVTHNPTYATSPPPVVASPTGTNSGVNPAYGGSTTEVPKAGRDSPGYGDLGIKHIGYPVYPGADRSSAGSSHASQQGYSTNPGYSNQARRGSNLSSTSSAV